MAHEPLPLSALLSAAFVAFAIELDNEAELRIPHSTTRHGGSARQGERVWLASIAMWFNCLRWVPEEGITVAELRQRARMDTNLDGMRRWRYVDVDPPPKQGSAKSYSSSSVLCPTRRGLATQKVWELLPAEIERRWGERFGGERLKDMRRRLIAISTQVEIALPDYLPILGNAMWTTRPRGSRSEAKLQRRDLAERERDVELPLLCLLARVLLAFAYDYEAEAKLPLAVLSDALRLIGQAPIPLRDLPAIAGVSKEAMSMALKRLERLEYVLIEPIEGGRGQQARLTADGTRVRLAGMRRLSDTEQAWGKCYGKEAVDALQATLEPLVGSGVRGSCSLFEGLQPSEGNWRAAVKPVGCLPWFPMVLHRGGYPDGS